MVKAKQTRTVGQQNNRSITVWHDIATVLIHSVRFIILQRSCLLLQVYYTSSRDMQKALMLALSVVPGDLTRHLTYTGWRGHPLATYREQLAVSFDTVPDQLVEAFVVADQVIPGLYPCHMTKWFFNYSIYLMPSK